MELHDIMVRALASSAAVVRDVTRAQSGLPTPCAEWDVRALSNHLLLVVEALELAGRGEPITDEHWSRDAARLPEAAVSARSSNAAADARLPDAAISARSSNAATDARLFDTVDADARSFGVSATDAWKAPEVWQRPVVMGGMPMPAEMAVAMLVSDVVIHGWDLARATGQELHVDDDVAATTLRFMTAMGDQGRAMGIFAQPVAVPGHASMLDRALALSGRDPSH
ncbi:TIGR03086 family metal-binding protein [Paractinoplanes lichenicola]|uniref:TIGR03086 family protein n=1 Tax=Paractinoplanes lichenicola TaxID=2802976 RepID=A0ABS1VYT0_9ACTN|nr:TIGR03086 family metal-binding protein [Actinoplanes lichenicola]MBL7259640.1 TIGR03086 family protein [Actinoplanes lichenicola]